jgi:membrane dipeptidase
MGGVIGLNGFPAFVSGRRWPTVDELVQHASYIADTVGVDHLSVGIDYYQGQWPFIGTAEAKAMYAVRVREGRWSPKNYPPPPYKYPKGIEVPSKLPALTAALRRAGFSTSDVRKVLGENVLRVFGRVWKAVAG